ncbi:hypothetical protein P9112_011158 [Eukaryota sp. TZLM1-RC]
MCTCPHLALIDFDDCFSWITSRQFQRKLLIGTIHCDTLHCYSVSPLWACLSPKCNQVFCSSDASCHSYAHFSETQTLPESQFSHPICMNVETGALFCHICRSSILSLDAGPFSDDVRDLFNAVYRPKHAAKLRSTRLAHYSNIQNSLCQQSTPSLDVKKIIADAKRKELAQSQANLNLDFPAPLDREADDEFKKEEELLNETVGQIESHAERFVGTLSKLRRSLSTVSLDTSLDEEEEKEDTKEQVVAEPVDIKENLKNRKMKRLQRMRSRASSLGSNLGKG